MSTTCCACCDCDCCIGSINDNLDHLTTATQILPQIHNQLSTYTTLGVKEQLSPENNILISFGNITYGKTLNLNIMNFLRKTTKYSNGIKIWVYSRKNSEINKIGWHHTTEEVKYYKNFYQKWTWDLSWRLFSFK